MENATVINIDSTYADTFISQFKSQEDVIKHYLKNMNDPMSLFGLYEIKNNTQLLITNRKDAMTKLLLGGSADYSLIYSIVEGLNHQEKHLKNTYLRLKNGNTDSSWKSFFSKLSYSMFILFLIVYFVKICGIIIFFILRCLVFGHRPAVLIRH